MKLRSLLFVPGDRPERMQKALSLSADALILDLEDSVLPSRKAQARACVSEYLATSAGRKTRLVRINALHSEALEEDLAAVMPHRPDGLVLPKAEGSRSIEALDRHLARLGPAAPPVLPIATETARAVFRLVEYEACSSRLLGLTWGAEDLSVAVEAESPREADGTLARPYEMVRSLALFAARAAGVAPIDTVYPAIRDLSGLEAYARRAMGDGFTGMMALHPAQLEVINAAFTPSAESIRRAQAIVAAFSEAPEQGARMLDGEMIDAPHHARALGILEKARLYGLLN